MFFSKIRQRKNPVFWDFYNQPSAFNVVISNF